MPTLHRLFVIAFAATAAGALLSQTSWRAPEAMILVDAGDALIERPRRAEASAGMLLYPKTTLIARTQSSALVYEGTTVFVEPHTNVQFKSVDKDTIRLFSTRGRTRVVPDRTLEYCTRRVCTITTAPVHFNYITPGEIIVVEPEGEAVVRFDDQSFALTAGESFWIDELSGEIQSPRDGVTTSATP